MKCPAAALMLACVLMALPATAFAKGGGHRSSHSTAPHARGRTHIGRPAPVTALPRPVPLPTFPIGSGPAPLPAYPLFGLYSGYGLASYAGAPPVYADVTGGLRLDVEPASAQVIVDGYYAGVVDDFSGQRHHLNLAPGPHHVELIAPGYQPLAFDLVIQPHHTTRFAAILAPSTP